MKYGITQWSFPGYGLYAVKQAALAGYEGLQLECGRQSYGYYLTSRLIRDSYKEDAKRYGIEFMSVVANDIMFISCQGNKAEQEYVDSVKSIDLTIQAAIDMECSKIMLPFFHKSQIRYEDEGSFDRAVRVVRETAEKVCWRHQSVSRTECFFESGAARILYDPSDIQRRSQAGAWLRGRK